MPYRIGVDVGGTFTDAVALDIGAMEVVGIVKTPTTHNHPNGVSEGIRIALDRLLEQCRIPPEEVAFIAHGTTQATNALLEGDVDDVAIVSAADGFWAGRVRSETAFDALELAAGKRIAVASFFLDGPVEQAGPPVMAEIRRRGIRTTVAATAYSVDDPGAENAIRRLAEEQGLHCTPSHEMSALYGLRTRARTAVINASILPKMVETTDFMERSVQAAGITKPLMIMRSDGGVMSARTIRERPIQTILSGPAAGVAGALLYGGIADGVFLEVGGTSTDVSVVRNGKVMVKWARIGGHKTYVNSLDIHTVAVAGGSMLRLENGRVVCGPRSAHIAGLEYCCFAKTPRFGPLRVETFHPPGDKAAYFVVVDETTGARYAPTLTCLANRSGRIPPDDFARGNADNAALALDALAAHLGRPADAILDDVLAYAAGAIDDVVGQFAETYRFDKKTLPLIGGGGGAALIGWLADRLGMDHAICPDARAISPIGVAMAMVRESCERTMLAPSREELLRLREEAIAGAVRAGAARNTVEVVMEMEPQKNLVRAVATGVTDGALRPGTKQRLSREELLERVVKQCGCGARELVCEGGNGFFRVFQFGRKSGGWLRALFGGGASPLFVLAADGAVRLRLGRGALRITSAADLAADLGAFLDEHSQYGDMGEKIPEVFMIAGERMYDYSMIREREQVTRLALLETETLDAKEAVFLVCGR